MKDFLTISFGSVSSEKDPRTLTGDMVAGSSLVPENVKVDLKKPTTDQISDQGQIGICTATANRMAVEHVLDEGVRLEEWWHYLMGKVFYDGGLWEGSSAFTMLRTSFSRGIPTREVCNKYPLKINGTYAQFIESYRAYGRIPEEILEDAKKHKIRGYHSVKVDPVSIAKELQAGRVVICRLVVGDNTYRDKNGRVSYSAADLLPWRAPRQIDSGHLMALNEVRNSSSLDAWIGCVQSWGERYCPDNTDQGAGYINFIFSTQRPYFTEAWAIDATDTRYVFKTVLMQRDTGADVVALQKVLVEGGHLVMPKGVSYGYFGSLTKAAVIKYQDKYAKEILAPWGLTKGTGFVGSTTLKQLNS